MGGTKHFSHPLYTYDSVLNDKGELRRLVESFQNKGETIRFIMQRFNLGVVRGSLPIRQGAPHVRSPDGK